MISAMLSQTAERIELFRYSGESENPEIMWHDFAAPAFKTPPDINQTPGSACSNTEPEAEKSQGEMKEERAANDSKIIFEDGRQHGFEEGRRTAYDELAAQQTTANMRRVDQVARCIERFECNRNHYFSLVEHEVVKLALAIAARILRREAQTDPLLLIGSVRAALGQLSRSSQAKLRVPFSELELWKESIAHIPNLNVKPVVLAGDGMQTGECSIETEIGSVDLSIRAQLRAIEHEFCGHVNATDPKPISRASASDSIAQSAQL